MLPFKDNYQAWLVRETNFPKNGCLTEQLKFLLNYAILAPSAHNTQPWKFVIKEENRIQLFLDKEKVLSTVSDKKGMQTYLGLGAALSNVLLSAEHFGLRTEVVYKMADNLADDKKKLIAEITFSVKLASEPNNYPSDLFSMIVSRRSAKLKYLPDKIGDNFIKGAMSLPRTEKIKLMFSDDKSKIKEVGFLVAEGTRLAFSQPDFRVELSHWIKNNWTREYEGMPGNTVGMPGLFSLFAPRLIRIFNIGGMQAAMAQNLVLSSPLVGVITVNTDEERNWFEAGGLFNHISLLVVKHSLGIMAMAAPIEYDEIRNKLKKLLCPLEADGLPVIFFRIGKYKRPPDLTPRRPLSQVLLN